MALTMMGSASAAASPSGEGSSSETISRTRVLCGARALSVAALLMTLWKDLAESGGRARMALLAAWTASSILPARMYSLTRARQALGLVGSDWTTA
jgi:hypothetical protein